MDRTSAFFRSGKGRLKILLTHSAGGPRGAMLNMTVEKAIGEAERAAAD